MKTTGKHTKAIFDAEGYQTNMDTLNGEPLTNMEALKWKPLHGGVRDGAGRKPSGRKPITLRLKPSVAKKLRAAARREKVSISDIAERWLSEV